MDLQEVGLGRALGWTNVAQDWALVNAVMNLRGSIQCGEFLDKLSTC